MLADRLGLREQTLRNITNGSRPTPAWMVEALSEISNGELGPADFWDPVRQAGE